MREAERIYKRGYEQGQVDAIARVIEALRADTDGPESKYCHRVAANFIEEAFRA